MRTTICDICEKQMNNEEDVFKSTLTDYKNTHCYPKRDLCGICASKVGDAIKTLTQEATIEKETKQKQ